MIMFGSTPRTASIVLAKCSAPPSATSSRATAVMTTCLRFRRRMASATRCGSSTSSGNGLAVETAQNPQARVQRSPAIMKVAVPWLQHSQRFGHWALSHTVCSLRSEIEFLRREEDGIGGKAHLDPFRFLVLVQFWINFRPRHISKSPRSDTRLPLSNPERISPGKRPLQRQRVGVLESAPGGQSVRDSRDWNFQRFNNLCEVGCCCLALNVRAQCKDDFLRRLRADAIDKLGNAKLVRSNVIERR